MSPKPVNYEYNRATIFKHLALPPKWVNYENNRATISNNQFCRPNPSIVNIIKPQILTIVTVAQTCQL